MMILARFVMLALVAELAAVVADGGAEPPPGGPMAEAGPLPPPEADPHSGGPPGGPPDGLLPGGPALRSPRIVHTRSGPLQGLILSMDGAGAGQRSLQPIEAFLGVPYATPPVGGNRFSPTRAPSPWDEVRVADRVRPACPQRHPDLLNETAAMERMPRGRLLQLRRLMPYLRAQSEDCLYLNIYTPAQAGSSDVQATRPVIVYIHGESFSWNSGSAYDGSVLASYSDVVVVTLNYRLGILGFLNANPSPGTRARVANYGLMDQIAALHWLQQNVALFGGDPRNVTLMGHGTGAACIHFLMMSPTVTPGLFQRAVLMSGSAYSPWALVQDPVRAAVRVASKLNCTVPADLARDHEDIVDCLRSAPLDTLLDAAAELPAPDYIAVFGPSVDGVVIKRDLVKEFLSASKKALSGVDGKEAYADGAGADAWAPGMTMHGARGYGLLCGVVTNEAVFRVPDRAVVAGLAGEQRDRMLRTYVRNTYTHHLSEIFSTVVNEYTDWERTALHPINTRDATVAALSDAQFVAPLVQTGDAIYRTGPAADTGGGGPARGPVVPIASSGGMGAILRTDGTGPFFYVFDYQTKEGDYPPKMGPAHGEELPYVFGAPLAATVRAFPSNYSKAEVALSEAVMTYWTNFARTGNPNQASAAQQEGKDRSKQRGAVGWEEYDAGHQKYLEIGLKPRMKNHFRAHKMSIWLRLVPELHRAGQEDVVARHNLFRNHNESSLYDGVVRPDPLGRAYGFGPLAGLDGVDDTGMLGGRHGNATPRLSDVFLPVTMPTCLNITGSYHTFGNGSAAGVGGGGGGGHGGAIGGGGDMMEPEGLAAYSTALGVTLAIGCSLLVLNVLIFAGVFYQRDRTRLQVKSLKQQQRIRGACEDLAGGGSSAEKAEKQFPHLRHSFSSSVIVDMEREKTACGAQQGQVLHCEKSPVSSMKSSKSGGGLATGLAVYTGQPPNYSSYLHQVADYPGGPMGGPGPAGGDDGAMVLRHSFHAANTFRDGPSRASAAVATLPRNMGVMNAGCKEGVTLGPAAMTSMGTSMGHSMTPNGCAGAPMHHTLPRPPPPPRVNSRASDGGDPQRDLRLPQAALSEMRV